MAEEAKWYVAHTYSGYENTVKATIEKAVENRNMGELIQAVNIPLETVTEITETGAKTVERKVFPGYVLVKMVMTDETWHLVRNVRGVTGFVGSGNKAIPLTDAEIAAMGVEKREVLVNYEVGSSVRMKPMRFFSSPAMCASTSAPLWMAISTSPFSIMGAKLLIPPMGCTMTR